MPLFRTARPNSLGASIQNLIGQGGGQGALSDLYAESMAAKVAHDWSAAEKLRAEAEAGRASLAARTNPAIAEQFATQAAGLDIPSGRRLGAHLRGDMEQPSGADIEDAGAAGVEARPYVTGAPVLEPGQRERFQNAIGATIANVLATGKTNAEQLAHAPRRIAEASAIAKAAAAADRGDVTKTNLYSAGVVQGKELTPFKTDARGIVTDEYTGALNEGGQYAAIARKAEQALERQRGAAAGEHAAKAADIRAGTSHAPVVTIKKDAQGNDMIGSDGKPVLEYSWRRDTQGRAPAPGSSPAGGRGGQRTFAPEQIQRWIDGAVKDEFNIRSRAHAALSYKERLNKPAPNLDDVRAEVEQRYKRGEIAPKPDQIPPADYPNAKWNAGRGVWTVNVDGREMAVVE